MDIAEFFDQYGFPLALVLALAIGRFVPGFIYGERKKEVEEANAEIRRLNEYTISEVVPALSRQADVLEQAMRLMTEMRDEQRHRERVEREEYQSWQRSHSPGHPPFGLPSGNGEG